MKSIQYFLIALMIVAAVPAYSASVSQVYACEQEDGASEEDLIEATTKWLKAARTVEGGENLQASLSFPVVTSGANAVDFLFIINSPSFAEWGTFWDNYPDSAAADADQEFENLGVCPGSALWESNRIEVE